MEDKNFETATLAAGCFWCVEAVFDDLKGVEDVMSGYSNGQTLNPTYQQVCGGDTGHAEVIQLKFDPEIISYRDILKVFFAVHDPTTMNRQGGDIGTQYRSAIFFHSPEQEKTAHEVIDELNAEQIWDTPIITEVAPISNYFPAENYHQEYFANNPNQPYCMAVVAPKVAKFRQKFLNKLKKSA
jgi:peptide-methionine (S)-S-oxide reductase